MSLERAGVQECGAIFEMPKRCVYDVFTTSGVLYLRPQLQDEGFFKHTERPVVLRNMVEAEPHEVYLSF